MATMTACAVVPATRGRVEAPARLVELIYVAYPSSLELRSANAVQTFNTLRELRSLYPELIALIPRLRGRPSAFLELGVIHLARLPFNVLGRAWRTTLWSYLERSWFAWRVSVYLLAHPPGAPRVLYVRDAICAAWFGAGLARLAGAALVYEVHDLEQWNPSRAKSRWGRGWTRLVDGLAIRRADRVVTLTALFRRYLDRAGLKRLTATAVIPDAYDAAVYRPLDRHDARRALGLPVEGFIVVYTGLTFAYRGIDTLLRAFARIRNQLPTALLVLAGGRNRERQDLATLARELGIHETIRLPGQVPGAEVARYLAAADCLVVPRTVSGLNASPLKLFEYAAMERPIVAVDSPALVEVLGADGALYVPVGDEAALARALRKIAGEPAEAARMAARARDRVAPHTYRARAEAIAALAEQVIAASDIRSSAPRW